jgi:phosphatidylinositol alpha-1,6-mannosyltransferase
MEGGESYKGHDHLIRAWPAITAAVPHARLLIAGAGSDYQRIHQMAEDSPAAQSIEMLGYIAEDALPALWRRAHIFAMPSTCEGFGLVYAEAMRQGLPVVASIHDAGAEVNAHNETGFNVDLNNPTDLRDRLLSLLTNPALLRKFAGAADERWRVLFRASAFRDRFQPQIMQFVERTAASKH